MQVRRNGIQLEMKESNFSVSAVWKRVVSSQDASGAVVTHIRHLLHPRSSVRCADAAARRALF
jgi:hypothetical protein